MKDSLIWLRRFVMLYGIIMICTFLMCLLFNPGAELPVVSFFGKIMVFSLIGLGSTIVYRSEEDLTQKAWWMRTVIHTLLLEGIQLPLAHHWGFWHEGSDVIVYAVFILLAILLWHLIDYGISARTAAQINEKIREHRLEKRK